MDGVEGAAWRQGVPTQAYLIAKRAKVPSQPKGRVISHVTHYTATYS